MSKSRILPYAPFPKGPLVRKLAPKYIHEWSIEDLNYLTPFEQSNFPSQLLRSIKKAKTISRVRLSGDLSKQSILPISHVIKVYRKYIKEIAASSFVRKKLMFLRHLNLKHLAIQLNQPKDWNLFLHSKNVSHLQIFLSKNPPGRNALAITQAHNNIRSQGNSKNFQNIQARLFQRKLCQLYRHSKSLHHLKRLIFTGEYDQSFLRFLEIFNKNLEYLISFETLNLTLTYEDTLSLQTIQQAQELDLWAYVSEFSIKLNNSMDLIKCQLDSAAKYINLRSLEIFSLFVVEKDFSFFRSLADLPSLFEVKIMLFGLNGTPSLVQFLSFINLPDTIENFSLTIKNTFPWIVDYAEKPFTGNTYQESKTFEKLKTSWEGLKSLQRFHLRVSLIFKESDVHFFAAWFQMFKALKELYLEIDNDDCHGGIQDRRSHSPETFDLKCLVDNLGQQGLKIEKLTVITKHLVLKDITPDLQERFKSLKCLTLKYVLAANQSFVDFMKVLPTHMEKLMLDELVIKNDQDLEYALEGLRQLRLVNIFRLTLYLDTRVNEAKIVEGICELVKHNKMSEEFVLFLNNMILGNMNFLAIKNEILKVGRKLKQLLGKVSDFNCNLCWSCKDCRIYYNQLDFFCEDFY